MVNTFLNTAMSIRSSKDEVKQISNNQPSHSQTHSENILSNLDDRVPRKGADTLNQEKYYSLKQNGSIISYTMWMYRRNSANRFHHGRRCYLKLWFFQTPSCNFGKPQQSTYYVIKEF